MVKYMNDNRLVIANMIRQCRKENGKTQKEIANKLNVNLKTYQKIENLNKEEDFNFSLFIQVLNYFDIKLNLELMTIQERIRKINKEDGIDMED